MTALLLVSIFMHVLSLQVAITAGDYQTSNLMQWWNSHKSFLLQWAVEWAATAKRIFAVQSSSAAIQREFPLVNSGLT